MEAALRKQLGQLLEKRIAQHKREIERLEEHLAELQGRVEKMENNKEKIIEARLMRLTGVDIEW